MPPKKDKPSIYNKDHFQETMFFLVALIILGALAERFVYFYNSPDAGAYLNFWSMLMAWLLSLLSFLRVFAIIVIGICLWWAMYSRMKLHNIEKEEDKIYGHIPGALEVDTSVVQEDKGNGKWAKVLEHLHSNNPSDWRLAIIEADIMLDELLTVNGYHGDSIGDKLKAVEPSDMVTLDAAWEAHKVRNRIAHSGSDFELNEREAKRVVTLFESVFKEYKII